MALVGWISETEEAVDMREYISCYFAFIDILGFKEIVKTKTCSEIADIFDEVNRRYIVNEMKEDGVITHVIPPEEINYYVMSDSVCIYIKDDIESALSILVWICLYFQVRLLCLETPLFVRGSISRGDVFEGNNVLFGPGMVEAYLRSEKIAHVPRIIMPENLYDETTDITDKAFLNGFTHHEQDGFYATNYINYFCRHDSTRKHREKVNTYIRKVLNDSLNQSVREKYMYVRTWMDYYYNQGETREP